MIVEKRILKKIEESDIVNGTVVIPSNITVIDEEAFINCEKLKNIVIPDTVKVIGKNAFINCKKLKSVILPKNLKEIQSGTFKNCSSLTNIEIPDSVKNIGEEAFSDCIRLFKVKLGANVESIDNQAFYQCEFLSKINLPESLKKLGTGVFDRCFNLRSIVVPSKITKIPDNTFSLCTALQKIIIPDTVTEIGNGAFFDCKALKQIDLPKNLKTIGNHSFKYCENLRKVNIPEKVQKIDSNAFENCYLLKEVNFPEELKSLGFYSFAFCYRLANVNLPKDLEDIDSGVFTCCYDLRNVKLPEKLKTIPQNMFSNCDSLTKIEIPNSVIKIDSKAFNRCKKLKIIKFPEQLQEISKEAFLDCSGLTEVELPTSLKIVGGSAFEGCLNLKSFNIPENVEEIRENCIKGCKKIKTLCVPESIKIFQNPNESQFEYVEKIDNGFNVLGEKTEKSVLINEIKTSLPIFFKLNDKSPDFLREQKNDFVADFYETFIPSLSEEQLDDFMKNHNFTFFKQIMKQKPEPSIFEQFNKKAFYTGYYNLGGLKPIDTYNGGKKIDYAQKVTGKLLEFIQNDDWRPYDKLSKAFERMNAEGFKKDYTDFFISNLPEIMREIRYNEEFVSRSYNEFEEIQATNTNDRGSQRQLKPTMEKFKSYFKKSTLRNVTPETKPIADMIEPYFNTQKDFDESVAIMNEFKENNVPENILSTPLYEENPFENIDKMTEEINDNYLSTVSTMSDLATDQFTYEWLAKNDPTNLILGKLCSCCAHLHGAGYGIMHASIVHPNVQNLVVRNEDGRIFAKSTLFINPDEQFGVLNNFEVYNSTFGDYKEKAYIHFMRGVKDFAEQYNKEHPDKPLKQINVGGNNNDLLYFVEKLNKKSPELLKAINYSTYGKDHLRYAGDSSYDQYIIWENEKLKKEYEIKSTEEIEKQS